MLSKTAFAGLCSLLTLALFPFSRLITAEEPTVEEQRSQARQMLKEQNYHRAFKLYENLLQSADPDDPHVGEDFHDAVYSLNKLRHWRRIDAVRDLAIERYAENWRLLLAAAQTFVDGPHYGRWDFDVFARTKLPSFEILLDSTARDRVRALRLLRQAEPLLPANLSPRERSDFYFKFANCLLFVNDMESLLLDADLLWEEKVRFFDLSGLTDLSTLPDFEESPWSRLWDDDWEPLSAPVDNAGNPLFYRFPESFEAAQNDGERWRWVLAQAAQAAPSRRHEAHFRLALYLESQFSVRTIYDSVLDRLFDGPKSGVGFFSVPVLGHWPGLSLGQFSNGCEYWSGFRSKSETLTADQFPYALHTLAEDETIAKLAAGIKRFRLPDDANFIKLYQQIAEGDDDKFAELALHRLARIFEGRRQYPRAAEYWRKIIDRYGPGEHERRTNHLEQIVGNWGTFESLDGPQPAGRDATVDYRFRNGRRVELEAYEIKLETFLKEAQQHLRLASWYNDRDWTTLDLERFIDRDEWKSFQGDRVAHWTVELEPPPDHFDKRITLTTPLKEAGVYLLIANMADGETSRILLWITDTVILTKTLGDHEYFLVADAETGRPIPNAQVDFFGYRFRNVTPFMSETTSSTAVTDQNGQLIFPSDRLPANLSWMAMARTDEGRLAHIGFRQYYPFSRFRSDERSGIFVITDRPVYRPGQTVKFKFWARSSEDVDTEESQFAERPFDVEITDEEYHFEFRQTLTTDAYGGADGEFTIPEHAPLGGFEINIYDGETSFRCEGEGWFRVEEYKKPEFEVTVEAPDEPVELGETFTATIRADYFFGAPVTSARIRYRVTRTPHTEKWYPSGRWDMLYGRGYGWLDDRWYGGWRWGSRWRSHSGSSDHPELVFEGNGELRNDGTLEIEIDTSLAKELHGGVDHRYTITAEVVDQSRRTITGRGDVLAARQAFQITAWTEQGFYNAGDTAHARFKALTLDSRPVAGTGELTLYRISYDDETQPVETVVQTWNLDTDDQGEAEQRFNIAEAGQYRIVYTLTGKNGTTVEEGHRFLVRGPELDTAELQFNNLELIPDKRDYRPGETVRLLINTNYADATVLLFVRPESGNHDPPKIVSLEGKSGVVEIPVGEHDVPNFLIEAVTISNARVHREIREIFVPPVQHLVEIELLSSLDTYRPGDEATLQVKLTDGLDQAFTGTAVLSIYDKSVESITGGSYISNIVNTFWSKRHDYRRSMRTNLDEQSAPLGRSEYGRLRYIGLFGFLIHQDETISRQQLKSARDSKDAWLWGGMGGFGGGAIGGMGMGGMDGMGIGGMGMDEMGNVDLDFPHEFVEAVLRSDFADTALWAPTVTPDENGIAEVSLTMPENLTTWKIRAWAMGHKTEVGEAEAEVVTSKDLLVRLQAPRFFTQNDEVVLSANVHNYLSEAKRARVVLELDGTTLTPLDEIERTITVDANAEQRVDWRVRASHSGEAIVRVQALTDEESDAMERQFPVHVQGSKRTASFAGSILANANSAEFTFEIPEDIRPETTRLEVRFSPTQVGAIIDALPYLVEYPYGCTEQTLNRFLPTVIARGVLKSMDVELASLQDRQSETPDPVERRSSRWQRHGSSRYGVFDDAEVERMVAKGVADLSSKQLPRGAWGWFAGPDEMSDPYLTALVVHGLQLARRNQIAVNHDVIQSGRNWLQQYRAKQYQELRNAEEDRKPAKRRADDLDAFIQMVLVEGNSRHNSILDVLYRDRAELSLQGQIMLGLTLHKQGEQERTETVLNELEQHLVDNEEQQTAFLERPGTTRGRGRFGTPIETNASYLKLLARTDPHSDRAARVARHLLGSRRRGSYWTNTRDTAIAIEALAEYLQAVDKSAPVLTVEVYVDGVKRHEVTIDAENMLTFDNSFVIDGADLAAGSHTVELRKRGDGPLDFTAFVTSFSQEARIAAAGKEIQIERNYYKLVPKERDTTADGSPSRGTDDYDRIELQHQSTLTSGDLIEVELVITSDGQFGYVLFEDMKPAGFEPIDVQSGYTEEGLWAFREFRDDRVAFFASWVPYGKNRLTYRMRAETPGTMSAPPTRAHAMYEPELRANSAESRFIVED